MVSVKAGYRFLIEDELSSIVGPSASPSTKKHLEGTVETENPKQNKNTAVAGSL